MVHSAPLSVDIFIFSPFLLQENRWHTPGSISPIQRDNWSRMGVSIPSCYCSVSSGTADRGSVGDQRIRNTSASQPGMRCAIPFEYSIHLLDHPSESRRMSNSLKMARRSSRAKTFPRRRCRTRSCCVARTDSGAIMTKLCI